MLMSEPFYKQEIRNLIFTREKDGAVIFYIAWQIEKVVREQIAKEVEAYAKTQEKTMQKAAYECVALIRKGGSE